MDKIHPFYIEDQDRDFVLLEAEEIEIGLLDFLEIIGGDILFVAAVALLNLSD